MAANDQPAVPDAPPRTPRALRGASAALISRVGGRLIGLGFVVVLSHQVDERSFAAYSYLLTLAATLSLVTDAGVAVIANREIASGRMTVTEAARAAAPTQIATSVLAALLVLAGGLVDSAPGSSGWPLIWTALFILLTGWFNFQAELLRSAGRPWEEASLQVLGAVLQIGFGVALLQAGQGLSAVLAVLAFKQLIVIGLAQIWLPLPFAGARPAPGTAKRFLRQGMVVGVASTLLALVLRFGQMALGNTGTVREIAVFGVAARYLEIVAVFAQTAGIGVLPALARRAHVDAAGYGPLVRRALWQVTVVAVIGSAIGVAIVGPFTSAVFGERYADAAGAARIFIGGLPVALILYLCWNALLASHGERHVLLASVAGAEVAVAGVVWIVEHPTSTVAAAATVATLGVTALVLLVQTLRS